MASHAPCCISRFGFSPRPGSGSIFPAQIFEHFPHAEFRAVHLVARAMLLRPRGGFVQRRAIEQRGKDKRPMLSDLRDSGAIEQDADIVMFIDRSMNEIEAESESRPDLGMAKLIVAKHRNGATRDIDLAFNPEFTKFMDFIDDSRVGSF